MSTMQVGAIAGLQAQMPVKDGELCLSGAGVKMTGVTLQQGHPQEAGRLLPMACTRSGLRY